MRARELAGASLLVLQLLWCAYQQTTPARYFCWAPLHEHVRYRVSAARAGGRQLNGAEVDERYGRRGAFYDAASDEFWELNAAQHVLDSVAWREAAAAPGERMRVTVRYRIDDQEPRTWVLAP